MLATSDLIYVCEWNLTDEEKERFKNSNVGDTIHIETEKRPVILQDQESGTVIIPVYTSEYEIARQYHTENYAIENTGWDIAIQLFKSCIKVMGDTSIILDIDSDKCLEIKKERLLDYLKLHNETIF